VVPARSLQLLVGTTFLICWVIPKAFLLPPFTILDPEEMFKIPAHLQVMNKCSLFQNNTTFLVWFLFTGFNLLFLSALDGNAIKITDTNFTELERLCDEFGFTELATKLSEFRPSMDFQEAETEDADARGRIAVLEKKSNQRSHVIAMLDDKVTQLSTDFWRLVGEVSSLRSAICDLRSAAAGIQTLSDEVSALNTQIV
jgi:hypothetical protein